jgi:hypothetical protein
MNRVYEIAQEGLAKARKVVLYGAGLAALGILEESGLPVAYLVDDTPGRSGRKLPNGLAVHSSDHLRQEAKGEVFILISAWTQNGIRTISERLQQMGFRFAEDFADCSILHFDTISAKLRSHLGLKVDLDLFSACRLWFLSCSDSSISSTAGTWLFVELMRWLEGRTGGKVAECGVYQGGNAFLALMLSRELRARSYQLFDSFQGFPELSSHDPQSRRDDFRDANLAAVTARMTPFANVEIHRGYFSETFAALADAAYALVYVDCDLYQATMECLDHFYPRLNRGGILLLHDFWLPREEASRALGLDLYQGVQRACRDYFGSEFSKRMLVFPETTHGLMVKDWPE